MFWNSYSLDMKVTQGASALASRKSGSGIDNQILQNQVMLDVAGFPAGVIDGKKGMSFKKAVQGFQESAFRDGGDGVQRDLDGAVVGAGRLCANHLQHFRATSAAAR